MTGDDADEIVDVSKCALAVVVPLTWAGFAADHEEGSGMDFARSYGDKSASARAKWSSYSPAAAVIRRLVDEAEEAGVTVARRARLTDLARLVREYRVVTLVTHTRLFQAVEDADIEGAAALIDLLRRPANLVRQALQDRLVGPTPAGPSPERWEWSRAQIGRWMLDGGTDEGAIAGATSAALSSLLTETEERFAQVGLPTAPVLDEVRLRPWTRPLLEAELAGHLRPAPAIELVGGMVTVPELVAAVPREYSGVIDLSACNSLFLSEAIKRASPGCTVVWNRMLARLVPCVQRYIFIIRELRKRPASYVDTLLRITGALRDR